MQVPKDAVNKGAMVLPGMASVAVVITVVEEGGNALPLGIGKVSWLARHKLHAQHLSLGQRAVVFNQETNPAA